MTIRGAMRTALVVTWLCGVTAGASSISCGGGVRQAEPAQAGWNPNQGPPPPPPSSGAPTGGGSGCSKDTDCKGDRVCDSGVCRAPN